MILLFTVAFDHIPEDLLTKLYVFLKISQFTTNELPVSFHYTYTPHCTTFLLQTLSNIYLGSKNSLSDHSVYSRLLKIRVRWLPNYWDNTLTLHVYHGTIIMQLSFSIKNCYAVISNALQFSYQIQDLSLEVILWVN